MKNIQVLSCDFDDHEHTQQVKILMNEYITDPMGGSKPLNEKEQDMLIVGLKNTPGTITLLAKSGEQYAGLLNAFVHFSTFAVNPMINIHDVIVKKEFRGQGIGRAMMDEIVKIAYEIGCSKLTLEVREDNVVAQNLYKDMGFRNGSPPMMFWTKKLE